MVGNGLIRVAQLVNTTTGDRFDIRQPRPASKSYGRRFTVVFDERMEQVAIEIGGNAARIFMMLPRRLDFRSFKPLRQTDLAKLLSVDQSVISRGLRELRQHGAIESKGAGATITWRLSRKVGFRGTAAQFHEDEREDRLQQEQQPEQPALALGPSRAIRGGKRGPRAVQ